MYYCKDKIQFINYMNYLKRMNKETILLYDSQKNKNLKQSFLKYLRNADLKRILFRIRIHVGDFIISLYSKKKEQEYEEENKQKNTNYFSNDKFVIYMAVYGNYDNIKEPEFIPDNCHFVIFTDQIITGNSIWKVKNYSSYEFDSLTNTEKNRYIKMHPHLLFPDYKYSIYIDGSVKVISDFTEFINLIPEQGVGLHLHSKRNCIYQEILTNMIYKKAKIRELIEYRNFLIKEHMPRNYGMFECGIIVREHNKTECKEIMESWWKLFYNYVKRDQLYLPYILYKRGISVEKIGILGDDIYHNYAFRIESHS